MLIFHENLGLLQHLETWFSEIGPVVRAFIVKDRKTGNSRGFGYVQLYVRQCERGGDGVGGVLIHCLSNDLTTGPV